MISGPANPDVKIGPGIPVIKMFIETLRNFAIASTNIPELSVQLFGLLKVEVDMMLLL